MYQETFKEVITDIFKHNANASLTEDELYQNPLMLQEVQKDPDEDLTVFKMDLDRLVAEHYLKRNPPTLRTPDTYQLVRMRNKL